jgi:hypothetical protein
MRTRPSVLHVARKGSAKQAIPPVFYFERQVKDTVFLDRMISTLSAAFAALAGAPVDFRCARARGR